MTDPVPPAWQLVMDVMDRIQARLDAGERHEPVPEEFYRFLDRLEAAQKSARDRETVAAIIASLKTLDETQAVINAELDAADTRWRN